MLLACARSLCLVSIFSTLATASGTFITSMRNATASTFASTPWTNTQPAIPPFPPQNSFSVPGAAPPSPSRNVTVHDQVHFSSACPSTLTTNCKIPGGVYSSASSHKPTSFIYTTTSSTASSSKAFPQIGHMEHLGSSGSRYRLHSQPVWKHHHGAHHHHHHHQPRRL